MMVEQITVVMPYTDLTFTINVTNVNDAPTISNLNGTSISYKDGDSAISVTSGASAAVVVADIDSSDFDGGSIKIGLDNATANDVIAIATTGNFSITSGSPNTLLYDSNGDGSGDTTIGTFPDFDYSTTWAITLAAGATPATITELLGAITYNNTSNNPSETDRLFAVQITDGDGTENDGVEISEASNVTISVSNVNVAPVISNLDGIKYYLYGK